jgi:large subunit ribosomal protein L9
MPVELILKKQVPGLGAEADLVKVKPGYARNYLLPRDLAAVATSASKKQIEELKRRRAEREAQELNEAQELATKLGKITVTFQMQSADTEQAKVFGSVTSADIAERLATLGHTIDKHKIDLPRPLKEIGEHTVAIELGSGVEAKIKVVLARPTGAEEAEDKPAGKGKRPAKTAAKSSKKED